MPEPKERGPVDPEVPASNNDLYDEGHGRAYVTVEADEDDADLPPQITGLPEVQPSSDDDA